MYTNDPGCMPKTLDVYQGPECIPRTPDLYLGPQRTKVDHYQALELSKNAVSLFLWKKLFDQKNILLISQKQIKKKTIGSSGFFFQNVYTFEAIRCTLCQTPASIQDATPRSSLILSLLFTISLLSRNDLLGPSNQTHIVNTTPSDAFLIFRCLYPIGQSSQIFVLYKWISGFCSSIGQFWQR